jgi:hypothetical protein
MSGATTNVIIRSAVNPSKTSRLPRWFNEFVLVCDYAREIGALDAFAQEFRLNRRGYQFIDAVIATMAFFTAQSTYSGFHGMLDEATYCGWSPLLASVAGRKKLPSQASMSRLLDSIPEEMADEFVTTILTRFSPDPWIEHDYSLWHDCRGNGWHGFAIDNRIQPLRRRALAEGEEFPPPRRLTERLGAQKGYSGRKRADVQMARSVLEYLGSGRYLAMNYSPGNGQLCDDFAVALTQIEQWANAQGYDPRRCFLCIDGERRGFPQLRTGLKSPVRFLTRLTHYIPLKNPVFRQQLANKTWQRVEDSQSGPRRWATEFGRYRTADGEARLVVSCFEPTNGKKSGAGWLVNGLQYEVFACDFDPCEFPAAEVVSTYFGRAGRQENNFNRESRDFNVDHVFSGNRGGQKVVMAICMWLRNLRPVLAAEFRGGLDVIEVEPTPRQIDVADTLPLEGKPDDDVSELPNAGHSPIGLVAPQPWWEMVAKTIDERLANEDGFQYDPVLHEIRCPKGVHLELSGLRKYGPGTVLLRFRIRHAAHCWDCPFREKCTSSNLQTYRREITITVCSPDQFATESAPEPIPAQPSDSVRHEPHNTELACSASEGFGFDPTHVMSQHDHVLMAMRPPTLVTSALHNEFRDLARRVEIEITLRLPPPKPAPPPYLSVTSAQRQRRRQTWDERLAWNALGDEVSLEITIKTHPDERNSLARRYGPKRQRVRSTG